jgi:F0F1-type ATP synthase assembly protein I
VTTISLEMSLPGVLGLFLDERWGTGALCTILGFAIGFSLGMFHLIKLAKSPPRGNSSGTDSSGTEGSNQESD